MDIPEFKFPNSLRLISMNTDNKNEISKLSTMINRKESDITILF